MRRAAVAIGLSVLLLPLSGRAQTRVVTVDADDFYKLDTAGGAVSEAGAAGAGGGVGPEGGPPPTLDGGLLAPTRSRGWTCEAAPGRPPESPWLLLATTTGVRVARRRPLRTS
jgi:hypothetical protein